MVDEYTSKDQSDELCKMLGYTRLDFCKASIEKAYNIKLAPTNNNLFYENHLYENPLIIKPNGSEFTLGEFPFAPGGGGPFPKVDTSELATSLFGRPITRRPDKDTKEWLATFLEYGRKIIIPKNAEKNPKLPTTFKVTFHKKLIDELEAAIQEISNDTDFEFTDIGTYCYRAIKNKNHPNSATLSYHSYGVAVDFNVPDNPFVRNGKPLTGGNTNRKMRTTDHPAVVIMQNHGFGWGGRYGDYMHFSAFNGG